MLRCILAGITVTYLLAVFQATLGTRLSMAGIPPDLLFVWTICVGLLGGARAGMIAGFACGALEGSLHQSLIAALAISKGISGLGAGIASTRFFRESWIVGLLAGAFLTVINDGVFLVLSGGGVRGEAGRLVLGRAVYHAILTPVAFWVVVRARQALLGPRVEAS
jgi:cell shape-determining protein MreD